MKNVRARRFPKIARVRTRTLRSMMLRFWYARVASCRKYQSTTHPIIAREQTHPSTESLERVHRLLVPCPILAHIVMPRDRPRRRRQRIELHGERPRSNLLPVALHIPHLLIKFQIVRLQRLDLRSQFRYYLELFSKFLRVTGYQSTVKRKSPTARLFQLCISLSEPIPLTGDDGQDGRVCRRGERYRR